MSEQAEKTVENPLAPESAATGKEGEAASQPLSLIMTLAATLLVSIGITVVGLLSYHQWFSRPQQRIATLDINEVMQIKQIQLTTLATRPGATDRDRESAYDQISQFGRDIETAIGELQRDCGCVLLVRAAVLKGHHEDLTAELKKRMGMENASINQAMDAFTGANRQPAMAMDTMKGRK